MIELPFPHKALWPNGGHGHWAVKAREVKEQRLWAFLATKAAKVPPISGRVNLAVTIHPKTANVIDRDNCVSALKSSFDGIAQALGVDDSAFNVPSLTFGKPVKGGKVFIELSPE